MVTLIRKVTVVMINIITKIRITIKITEKLTTTTIIMVTTQQLGWLSRQKHKQIGNTKFKFFKF